MKDFDLVEIIAEVAGNTPVKIVDPGSPETEWVPSRWRAITAETDAATRCSAALALWNQGFLDLLPQFADRFRERLADVRVCRLRDDWILLYIARDTVEPHVVWIGRAPESSGDARPPFWDTLPHPVREFLTNVHAGFTGPNWESHGLVPPAQMRTFADWAGFDDVAIAEWEEDVEIASTRMAVVTTNGSLVCYCASPDIPAGKIALVYEGDIDDENYFGAALDRLMSGRFTP